MQDTKFDETIGSNYVYSNFGYYLLGRIIEEVSQKSYLTFLQETFELDVKIGGSTIDKLQHNETFYYSRDEDDCFNMPLARMDSCAGLIISPSELVRWANGQEESSME